MGRLVSADECEEMNRLDEHGKSYYAIADVMDRHHSTVTRHCNGGCHHNRSDDPDDPESIDVIAAIETLAATLGRVPTSTDWESWIDRPCTLSTLQKYYGNWNDMLEESDLPVVPYRSPDTIRKMAYDQYRSEVDA